MDTRTFTAPFTARTATTGDLTTTIELCLDAFADEDVITWLLGDIADRRAAMRQMFTESLGAAVEAGAVILAVGPDGAPVAVSFWLTQEGDPAPPPEDRPAPAMADGADPEDPLSRRLTAVHQATAARHPKVPHLLLSSMATLPAHRGRGAGGVLMRTGLDRARTLGLPVYLEASNSGNRRLYERFGLRDHGEPIVLPAGGPAIQPMLLGG